MDSPPRPYYISITTYFAQKYISVGKIPSLKHKARDNPMKNTSLVVQRLAIQSDALLTYHELSTEKVMAASKRKVLHLLLNTSAKSAEILGCLRDNVVEQLFCKQIRIRRALPQTRCAQQNAVQ